MKRLKILIPVSPGGHLYKIDRLKKWWSKHDRIWVTRTDDSTLGFLKNEIIFEGNFPENRNVANFMKNLILAFKLILKENPDIIFSTGAGIAPPFFFVGKLFGKKLVYVESLIMVDHSSLTGKMIYPIADLFFVQNSIQKKYYPKAIYCGSVL